MKNAVVALAIATMLSSVTPVMAENPVEPDAPGSDKTPGVTPNDAKDYPKDDAKNTGAMNPDTPDPTKNTPGAETKN
jgi:hypothetical protein